MPLFFAWFPFHFIPSLSLVPNAPMSLPSIYTSVSATQSPSTRRLSLPRFTPPHPLTPISYPYDVSSSIRSTLRPRRRTSIIRLAQRRALHLFLAVLIPLFILLLLGEQQAQNARRELMRDQMEPRVTALAHLALEPPWWGNVDEVGKSPWDHTPKIVGSRRILFLTGGSSAHPQ